MGRLILILATPLATLVATLLAAGCTQRPAHLRDRETAIASAEPRYWFDQPAAVQVVAGDYQSLWDQTLEAAERFQFEPALRDYRGGRLTTEPLVSAYPLEVWRSELRDTGSVLESGVSTVRRRVHFEIESGDEFVLTPRVVVEKRSLGERRISTAVDYRRVLGGGEERGYRADEDAGLNNTYWYAVGRDEALERSLANRIASRTGGRVRQPTSPEMKSETESES